MAPDGFGVRFDAGYAAGDTVCQFYDNLSASSFVWGRDRASAIARTICALEEMVVTGVATTIPADLAILRHPDFAAVEHSTKWVEERLDLSGVRADARRRRRRRRRVGDRAAQHHRRGQRQALRRHHVGPRVGGAAAVVPAGPGAQAQPARRECRRGRGGGSGDVTAPMQGTIVKVLVEPGQASTPATPSSCSRR